MGLAFLLTYWLRGFVLSYFLSAAIKLYQCERKSELVKFLLCGYHYPTTMYLACVKMSWCVMKAPGVLYIMWKNFPLDWCIRIQGKWLSFSLS